MSNPARRLVFFDFVTHVGGAQQSTLALGRRLRQNHDLTVLDAYGTCRDYLTAWQQMDVATSILEPRAQSVYIGHEHQPIKRIVRFVKQGGKLWQLTRQLKDELKRQQPDFIWTNSLKGLQFLHWAGALRRTPVAWYARGWSRKEQVPAWGRHLVNRLPCVLAVSQATAQALQQWGVVPDKIHVVHSIIENERLHQQAEQGVVQEPPRSDALFKCISPAQLIRSKGQHTAVAAIKHLRDEGLDIVLWLCGDVKVGGRQEYRHELQRMIETFHLEQHVFLLGSRPDVPALIRRADAVILPTHTEGWPRVVWEAQALERPVIASPVGGVMDLIEHERTGLLVPTEDERALALAIKRLVQSPSLCQTLVQPAKERLLTEFAAEKQLQAFEHALQSVCH